MNDISIINKGVLCGNIIVRMSTMWMCVSPEYLKHYFPELYKKAKERLGL